jgi:hypothetical protein
MLLVEMAAREMPRVDLEDALRIVLLMERSDDQRFDRAAARWFGRLIAEAPNVGLDAVRQLATALDALPSIEARSALAEGCQAHGLYRVAQELRSA